MLTKRIMETHSPAPPLAEPPLVESADRTSAKRRRRTRYTPLPGIMEHAVAHVRRDFERVGVYSRRQRETVLHRRGLRRRALVDCQGEDLRPPRRKHHPCRCRPWILMTVYYTQCPFSKVTLCLTPSLIAIWLAVSLQCICL